MVIVIKFLFHLNLIVLALGYFNNYMRSYYSGDVDVISKTKTFTNFLSYAKIVTFIGLFTFNWLLFLMLAVLIYSQVKLLKTSGVSGIRVRLLSCISAVISLLIPLNSFHLKFNFYEYIITLF